MKKTRILLTMSVGIIFLIIFFLAVLLLYKHEKKQSEQIYTMSNEVKALNNEITNLNNTIKKQEEELKESYAQPKFDMEISAFNKIVCCGDSLTAGSILAFDGEGNFIVSTTPDYSYPVYLEKITNVETVSYSKPGFTTVAWYEEYKDVDISGFDCAILQFGANDYSAYDGWNSNSENAYLKIINKLKNENKQIFIFISTLFPTEEYSGSLAENYSEGVRKFVSDLNDDHVILIDLAKYSHVGDYVVYGSDHLTAIGYRQLAQDYTDLINEYMRNNKVVFSQLQFSGTDNFKNF